MSGRDHVDVLLVDDDEGIHFLVMRNLRRTDVTLQWFADGKSAHEFLRTRATSLLLLDQRLPDCLGHELLERLHDDDLIGTADVAICTAEPPPPPIRARIAALGATLLDKSDILSKDGVRSRLGARRPDA